VITGDAIVGSTLSADPGNWSDPTATFSYAWLRCDASGSCTTIDGIDGTTYVLIGDDVGFHIGVTVTAANAGGTGSADSNLVGPVVPQAPTVVTSPSVSGDAIVGSTLTADPGSWSDPAATFSYAWLRCDDDGDDCMTIEAADGAAYKLTGDDLGFRIEVAVTAANAGGATTAQSAPTAPVKSSCTPDATPPSSP
jgi:hypothetical protein